ncbi:MAG: hypothetical protein ACTSQG_02790 [Promethearchaeota archaeon]
MEKIPEQVIIIGGGNSVTVGLEKGLKEKITNKFTIGTNINAERQGIKPTITTFVDLPKMWQIEEYKKFLIAQPLVIGRYHSEIEDRPNFFLFHTRSEYFGKDSIRINKVYTSWLTGLFTLTICIALEIKRIYCLGFDWTSKKKPYKKNGKKRIITHHWQEKYLEENYHGFGKTPYDDRTPEKCFKPYLNENVEIIIVGESNINVFPKINYDEFFERLKKIPDYNQNELREIIKKEINEQRKKNKN